MLIITYYWPPSGGSGVQRWMYFAKYLPEFKIHPIVITVDPEFASYKFSDFSFLEKVSEVEVYKTRSSEPFKLYSKFIGKSKEEAIPQAFTGESNPTVFQKIGRFLRGNFFIPDARIGWVNYAFKEAELIIAKEKIDVVITTGPPHSTHLIGLKLKKKYNLKWIADFRDPWTELFYNKLFFRTSLANLIDRNLEAQVINSADNILTIGPSMADLLKSKIDFKVNPGKKVSYIYNGYDHEVFKKIKRTRKNPKFTICHLGILSDNQPIDGFIEALKNANGRFEMKVQLIGKISTKILKEIKAGIPEIELELFDYMNHQDAMQAIQNADLLLNSLAEVPNGKYLISGKLIEYIATGNPILCLGTKDGDASKILEQFENSKVIDRYNFIEIASLIDSIFIKWKKGKLHISMDHSFEKYSRFNSTIQLADLIDKI